MLPREMSVTQFKATCLAVIAEVNRTQQTVILTKHGKAVAEIGPTVGAVRPRRQLGTLAGLVARVGDWDETAPLFSDEEVAAMERRMLGDPG